MSIPASLFLAADESIPQIFGLNWAGFIAQVITFGIVAYVLKTYAFQPIIDVLEERRRRISEGQANAEKIKAQLAESEVKYREMLDQANAQSQKLIDEARTSGEAVRVRAVQDATAEAERVAARGREQTQLEHDRVISEIKREMGRLVIETTSKVTGKVLTAEDQQRIGEETTRQIA